MGDSEMIVDFNKESDLQNWNVVDDVVMGGRSSGSFMLNQEGHAVFKGSVSLENNGGFSSVQYAMERTLVKDHTKAVIRLKGDGKRYQFRVKANRRDYYSYISYFQTSGEWEEIEIPLDQMYASFRGRTLNMPNFSNDFIEELRFLIANKKPEEFKLVIDRIELR
jgi:hypothetical protein